MTDDSDAPNGDPAFKSEAPTHMHQAAPDPDTRTDAEKLAYLWQQFQGNGLTNGWLDRLNKMESTQREILGHYGEILSAQHEIRAAQQKQIEALARIEKVLAGKP